MFCAALCDGQIEKGVQWSWDAAEERFMDEANVHFRYVWDHLDEEKRRVLSQLVSTGTVDSQYAQVLRGLERDGYAVGEGKQYRPFSKGLLPYIKEVAPPPASPPVAATQPPESSGLTPHVNPALEPLPRGQSPYPALIGQSEAIRWVYAFMRKAIAAEVTVLLLGQTGVGKERVARTIHQYSRRQEGPFVALNCGAVAEHLLESELFGHKKGSFTGAMSDREGLFEAANGGTLFLDEIGEINPAAQVKLLRVLQENEIRRVGENRPRPINVRLICATNRSFEAEMEQGRFREDLYFRLYVLAMEIPPLRQRREDIPLLIAHFLRDYASGIAPKAVAHLQAYAWPGNIRELENQILSAQAMAEGAHIKPNHLWPRLQKESAVPAAADMPADIEWTLREGREYFDRRFVSERIEIYNGDLIKAANSLGLSRSRLYQLVERFGLKKD
jgi:two-component system response regulator AtoC